MENDLDEIANAKEDNIKVLKTFYNEFEPLVKKAFSEMEKRKPKKLVKYAQNVEHHL